LADTARQPEGAGEPSTPVADRASGAAWVRLIPFLGADGGLGGHRGGLKRVTAHGGLVMWAAGAAAFMLFVVGTVYHSQQIFVTAGVIGLLLPMTYVLSLRSLDSVDARVTCAPRGTLHEYQVAHIGVGLTNRGRLPRCFCSFNFRLPEGLMAEAQDGELGTLLGAETREVDVAFHTLARGVYRVDEAELETTDLLGVFEFSRVLTGFGLELVVYPAVYSLGRWASVGRNPLGDVGAPSRTRAGESVDFHGIREYRSGDEPRRIHWPTTARTGNLSVIEFEDLPSRGMVAIVDCCAGTDMGPRGSSTLDCAARAAASLAALACSQHAPFELVAMDSTNHGESLAAGSMSAHRVYEALARLQGCGEAPIDQVCAQVARRLDRGASVFVLTSECGPPASRAVLCLLAAGLEPTVVLLAPAAEGSDEAGAPPSLWERLTRRPARTDRGDDAESVGFELMEALNRSAARIVTVDCGAPLGPQLEVLLHG